MPSLYVLAFAAAFDLAYCVIAMICAIESRERDHPRNPRTNGIAVPTMIVSSSMTRISSISVKPPSRFVRGFRNALRITRHARSERDSLGFPVRDVVAALALVGAGGIEVVVAAVGPGEAVDVRL